MRAGQLDRRIVIQAPSDTLDEYGQKVPGWTAFATVWAQKADVRARERFASEQPLAEETVVFRIRWRAGVTAAMRILHDGKVYGIDGVAEIGRREGLELAATAIALPQG